MRQRISQRWHEVGATQQLALTITYPGHAVTQPVPGNTNHDSQFQAIGMLGHDLGSLIQVIRKLRFGISRQKGPLKGQYATGDGWRPGNLSQRFGQVSAGAESLLLDRTETVRSRCFQLLSQVRFSRDQISSFY